jgi:hypothetical protein
MQFMNARLFPARRRADRLDHVADPVRLGQHPHARHRRLLFGIARWPAPPATRGSAAAGWRPASMPLTSVPASRCRKTPRPTAACRYRAGAALLRRLRDEHLEAALSSARAIASRTSASSSTNSTAAAARRFGAGRRSCRQRPAPAPPPCVCAPGRRSTRVPMPGMLSSTSVPPACARSRIRLGQAEAGALARRLGREERIERLAPSPRRHARPAVASCATST